MNETTKSYLPSINDCINIIIDALIECNIESIDDILIIDDASRAEIFIAPDDDDIDIIYPDEFIDAPELKHRIECAVSIIKSIKSRI